MRDLAALLHDERLITPPYECDHAVGPHGDYVPVCVEQASRLAARGVTVGLDVERIKREERLWGSRCTGCSCVERTCDRYRAEQRVCCPDCEHVSLFVVEPTVARAYAATPAQPEPDGEEERRG